MGRSPSRDDSGLKKGPWTPEEDDKLVKYVQRHGHGSWRALPKLAGLNRCGKSCRLRWTNYLRPDIKRGKFSQDEEQTILNLHAVLGNKWSAIATHLPGRTDNEIKNFWNTHLKKKLIQMGFDPMTHRPRTDVFSALPQLMALANLLDTSSWEDQALRLQSDVVQIAHLNQSLQSLLQPLPLPLAPPATDFQNNITTNVPADQLASFGLLNSLKDSSSSVLSLLEAPPPSLPAAGFFQDQSMPAFSRLPDLQAPCSVDNWSSVSKGCAVENSPGSSSPWPQQNLSQTPPSAAAPVAETSAMVDSYDGAQMWSELLNDPIFHDIA